MWREALADYFITSNKDWKDYFLRRRQPKSQCNWVKTSNKTSQKDEACLWVWYLCSKNNFQDPTREEDGRDVNHHGRDADLVSRKENVQVEVKFSDQAVRTGLILSSGPQEEVQGGCRQEVKQKTVESFEVLQLLYHPNYFDHFFPWLLCGRLSAFNLMCPCLINKWGLKPSFIAD